MKINIVVTDVVNDVTYSRKRVNTRVVITFLLHDVIHWKTGTSFDKVLFQFSQKMSILTDCVNDNLPLLVNSPVVLLDLLSHELGNVSCSFLHLSSLLSVLLSAHVGAS